MRGVENPRVFRQCFPEPDSFVRPWRIDEIRRAIKMDKTRTAVHLFHIRLVKSDGEYEGSARVNMAVDTFANTEEMQGRVTQLMQAENHNACLAFYIASQEDMKAEFHHVHDSCKSCRKGYDKLFTAIRWAHDSGLDFRVSQKLFEKESLFYMEELTRKISSSPAIAESIESKKIGVEQGFVE